MGTTPSILAFAGSARKDSFNKRLAKAAAESAIQAGAEVTLIDMRDYPMPLYDGDWEAEQGIPEPARVLRKLMSAHQGLIIATPEYNGFISPLLKNTLDWISRPDGEEEGRASYKNKIGMVLSSSPGGFGGMRAIMQARQLLNNLGVMVIPDQLALSKANEAFNDLGNLVDEAHQASLDHMTRRLVDTIKAQRPVG